MLENKPFVKVSKFKMKSSGFGSFHVGDAQNNFFGFLSLIIFLMQTFLLKKIGQSYEFIIKIRKINFVCT